MSDQTDPSSPTAATSIVQAVSPAPRDRWRRVMAADPHAMVTQSPEWVDVMTATSNRRDASIWFKTADGRELVLRQLGGPIRGNPQQNMPRPDLLLAGEVFLVVVVVGLELRRRQLDLPAQFHGIDQQIVDDPLLG